MFKVFKRSGHVKLDGVPKLKEAKKAGKKKDTTAKKTKRKYVRKTKPAEQAPAVVTPPVETKSGQ